MNTSTSSQNKLILYWTLCAQVWCRLSALVLSGLFWCDGLFWSNLLSFLNLICHYINLIVVHLLHAELLSIIILINGTPSIERLCYQCYGFPLTQTNSWLTFLVCNVHITAPWRMERWCWICKQGNDQRTLSCACIRYPGITHF